jgi:hypothetical protein
MWILKDFAMMFSNPLMTSKGFPKLAVYNRSQLKVMEHTSRVHDAMKNNQKALQWTGYLNTYASCPIIWKFTMQTTVALSTTTSEYEALSTAMRKVLPLMAMVRELKQLSRLFIIEYLMTTFDDNSGALESAKKASRMRPRTKYLNLAYHHFGHHVENGDVSIHPIGWYG